MLGRFVCKTPASFTSLIEQMSQREVLLHSQAIYRGQLDPGWRLQSHWERWFLHPQRAGLFEPYYIQPHEPVKVRLQRTFLEVFRRSVERMLPRGASRTDEQLWALGRHHGLITPLLDWTLDPYKALHFALRHRTGTERAAAVWVFHASDALPFGGIWDPDGFPRVDWTTPASARQRAQEGVFTRLSDPIFADLGSYLDNRLPAQCVPVCLIKIEILKSAISSLLREIAQRGINDASLGFEAESDDRRLDDIAECCNATLMTLRKPPAPPAPPRVDQEQIFEAATLLARRVIASIGTGPARPGGELWFKKLLPPFPPPMI